MTASADLIRESLANQLRDYINRRRRIHVDRMYDGSNPHDTSMANMYLHTRVTVDGERIIVRCAPVAPALDIHSRYICEEIARTVQVHNGTRITVSADGYTATIYLPEEIHRG